MDREKFSKKLILEKISKKLTSALAKAKFLDMTLDMKLSSHFRMEFLEKSSIEL